MFPFDKVLSGAFESVSPISFFVQPSLEREAAVLFLSVSDLASLVAGASWCFIPGSFGLAVHARVACFLLQSPLPHFRFGMILFTEI